MFEEACDVDGAFFSDLFQHTVQDDVGSGPAHTSTAQQGRDVTRSQHLKLLQLKWKHICSQTLANHVRLSLEMTFRNDLEVTCSVPPLDPCPVDDCDWMICEQSSAVAERTLGPPCQATGCNGTEELFAHGSVPSLSPVENPRLQK